jgi:hypothetical protein
MPARATSLLRTVFYPVCTALPRILAARGADLPISQHHNVPTVHLHGLLLERPVLRDPQSHSKLAADMYAGIFCFGDESVSCAPDALFTIAAPGPTWRSSLLRMAWLSSFRGSGKSLHGLYALRLISAWISARPKYLRDEDRIEALFNLAIDAPALAARQSPAAVAVAQAAILRAQSPVLHMRPTSTKQACARCLALLAAHLAIQAPDLRRTKLLDELSLLLAQLVEADGSHVSGQLEPALSLANDLSIIQRGLTLAGEQPVAGVSEILTRLQSYIEMLTCADGSLAFHDYTAPCALPSGVQQTSRFADRAGQARLSAANTTVFVSSGELKSASHLQLEIHGRGEPLLCLTEAGDRSQWRRNGGQLLCAPGGSLLEIPFADRQGNQRRVSIFLAATGEDIRLEDATSDREGKGYMIWFPETTKLSTTHGGTGALIAFARHGTWQMLARNCRVEQHGSELHISPLPQAAGPLNVAMKRIAEVTVRESRKKTAARPRPDGIATKNQLL